VEYNKTELFHFLAELSQTDWILDGKVVILTCSDDVCIYGSNVDVTNFVLCSHKEADMCIILHCWHRAICAMHSVTIRGRP